MFDPRSWVLPCTAFSVCARSRYVRVETGGKGRFRPPPLPPTKRRRTRSLRRAPLAVAAGQCPGPTKLGTDDVLRGGKNSRILVHGASRYPANVPLVWSAFGYRDQRLVFQSRSTLVRVDRCRPVRGPRFHIELCPREMFTYEIGISAYSPMD